jgi:hypothetical protein
MPPAKSAIVQLHLELRGDFLVKMLDEFGVSGWNRWIDEMTSNRYLPTHWSADEAPPPVWYWLNFDDVDLSGRTLDGIDFDGIPSMRRVRFYDCSLIDAQFGGCCLENASFRRSNLRRTNFRFAEISGANFQQAEASEAILYQASFDSRRRPTGIDADALRFADETSDSDDDCSGDGATEHPVDVRGSLIPIWR